MKLSSSHKWTICGYLKKRPKVIKKSFYDFFAEYTKKTDIFVVKKKTEFRKSKQNLIYKSK